MQCFPYATTYVTIKKLLRRNPTHIMTSRYAPVISVLVVLTDDTVGGRQDV